MNSLREAVAMAACEMLRINGCICKRDDRSPVTMTTAPACIRSLACADAALAAIEESGWVVAPAEPTFEMEGAGGDIVVDFDSYFRLPNSHARACYKAMLASRPRPTDGERVEEAHG